MNGKIGVIRYLKFVVLKVDITYIKIDDINVG